MQILTYIANQHKFGEDGESLALAKPRKYRWKIKIKQETQRKPLKTTPLSSLHTRWAAGAAAAAGDDKNLV